MLALATGLGSEARAASPGYWQCSAGKWVAVGRPRTDKPLWDCSRPIAIPETRTQCLRAGGKWAPAGIFPQPICRMPTEDAGRVCSDDGECQGSCLADLTDTQRRQVMNGQRVRTTGECTPTVQVFGCQARVEQGYVTGILCLD